MDRFKKNLNLLSVLTRMHLRSSDYRTFLGALWSFVGPLLTFAVLYLIFAARFGQGISLFSLKLLTGVIVIHFFSSVIQVILNAMRQSREIVQDCLAPSEVLMAAPLAVPFLKFLVEIGLCVLTAVFCGVFSPVNLPALVGMVFLFLMFSAGAGLWLGVLNGLAADVGEIWLRIEPLMLFVSPIFYSVDMLSPWGRWAVTWLNPVTPFLVSFQALIAGQGTPALGLKTVLHAVSYAGMIFGAGYILFKKFERHLIEAP